MAKMKKLAIIKDAVIYGGGELLNKLLPFLLLPILTRFLVPENYGKVAIFETFFAVSMLVIGLGGSTSIKFFFFRLDGKEFGSFAAGVVLMSVGIAGILLLLVTIFRNSVSDFLSMPSLWIKVALMVALCEFITSLKLTLWQVNHQAIRYGMYRVIQTVLNFSFSLALVVLLEKDWEGRVSAISIASILFGFLSLCFLYRDGFLSLKIRTNYLADALKFGLPLVPHATALWARTGVDRLLLVTLIGTAAVGVYAAAFQIALVLSVLGRSFRMAWEPRIIKGMRDEKENYKLKLVRQVYCYFICIGITAAFIAYFSEEIASMVLGELYADTGDLLAWAVWGQAFIAMKIIDIPIMFVGKNSALAWIGFFSVLLHLVLGYIFINFYGVIGVVWAGAVSFGFGFIVTLWYCQKVYPLPWFSAFRQRYQLLN